MLRSQTSLCVPMSLIQELSSRTNPPFSYKYIVPILCGGGNPYPTLPHCLCCFFFLKFLIFHMFVHAFAILHMFDVIDTFTSFLFVCLFMCFISLHTSCILCIYTWHLSNMFVTFHMFNGVGTFYFYASLCIFIAYTFNTHVLFKLHMP